ncbi:nidogen-2 [Platysternon megacephalum]|uniref:Nidogen-2 n=1 Tax=Platysternon megacephalum TaxID=55544 RepID=A0A4D9DH88_9SAUR|nr:nidogen-2 [Platysternon megacephalum]
MWLAWALLWALCWVPSGRGEYALPKFVCSPMPLELETGCQQAPQPRAGGHWAGTLEEAKETILHLRETVVHQKETILDQRETVRELTAKLSRCEGRPGGEHGPGGHEDNLSHGHREGAGRENEYPHFGHREHPEPPGGAGHEAAFRKASAAPNTMEDPPREAPAGAPQLERMLESLKERLEHLQHSRNSSLFSISLRDALQKKISILEHQIREKFNTTEHHDHSHEEPHHGHEEPHWHKNENHIPFPLGLVASGRPGTDRVPLGHKVEKPDEVFRVGFPLRTNYMYVKVKRTLHHEIFAFTVCLWLKSSSAPGVGTPFSYSVPGQANELVLIEWGNNPMELLINDKDTLGGRFDATQAFIGELADFNVWSHVLAPGEVYRLATCAGRARGDLVAWAEGAVELHGGLWLSLGLGRAVHTLCPVSRSSALFYVGFDALVFPRKGQNKPAKEAAAAPAPPESQCFV